MRFGHLLIKQFVNRQITCTKIKIKQDPIQNVSKHIVSE